MRKSILRLLFYGSLSLLLLSGCGGGGGGGSHVKVGDVFLPDFVKWSEVDKPGDTHMYGTSQTGSFTSTTSKIEGSPQLANVTITYDKDGKIIKITLAKGGTDLSWDIAKGDEIDAEEEFIFVSNKEDTKNALFSNPSDPNEQFYYQTYGVWMTEETSGSGKFGAISMGNRTRVDDLQKLTGKASFTGSSTGIYINGSDQYLATSSVDVDVDFSKRELDFNTYGTSTINLAHLDTDVPQNNSDLDMAGQLKYTTHNEFTGPVIASGGMTGSSTGHFYGPNAEEVGGVFDLKGTGETYIGAYGGKRK